MRMETGGWTIPNPTAFQNKLDPDRLGAGCRNTQQGTLMMKREGNPHDTPKKCTLSEGSPLTTTPPSASTCAATSSILAQCRVYGFFLGLRL